MQEKDDAPDNNPVSLSTLAYEHLLMRLRGGHLVLGERLVEADIAAQLGVSRVPVRQALLQLVAEGYLVSTPRGYKVPSFSATDVEDVFELRLLLEPRAAALAARDMVARQLALVDQALADARAADQVNDAPGFFNAGRQFRDAWLGAVKNSRLAASITRYADQVAFVRRMTLSEPQRRQTVMAGYQALQQAFSCHDSIVAHDCMVQMVIAAKRDFVEVVRQS